MTQPGGSTSVHTFIFKTVGGAAVDGAVKSATKHINGLVGSINKATHATKAQRMSAEMHAAVTAKMSANIANAEARLESFRYKMDANAGVAGRAAAQFRSNEQALNVLAISLKRAEGDLQRANDASKKDTASKRKLREEIAALQQQMGGYAEAQQRLNLIYDAAIRKEKLYQASLKAREARLVLLKTKEKEAAPALTKWEQFIATSIRVYKAVDQVSRTLARISRTANNASEAAQRFLNIWDRIRGKKHSGGEGMLADIGGNQSGMGKFHSQVLNVRNGLGLLGQTAAHVFGGIILGGLARVTQALAGLVQQSFQAVSGFERMKFSFEAIIGVQKMNADATLEMNDALAASSVESIKLIKWLEKLGIQSPFSTEDVKQAFQNAISMGFNVEQAQRLTKATLDWAAANGKSGATAEHVVFVLGQMRNASKLTYQDLMQLSQMGIGLDTINRALAKQMGKTIEEIQRMREEGEITASQAIPALIEYMEQFGGAAKKQANTIEGLLNSLKDIGPIFLRAFFGPMDEATGKIEGVVGAIQSRLSGLVSFLQNDYVINLAKTIGQGFGRIADNALIWGENVTVQFANGMINGLWAVLDSLISVGNLVASYLQPGSPPKILPDIDKWGAQTLNEYFRGFKMADFSLFDTIANQVSQTLQAAFGDNRIGFLEAMMGVRGRLGAAIAGGGNIGDILGGLSVPPELKAYIETMFKVGRQTKVVEAAQKALNDTIKKYDELLKPVDDKLQEISDEQQNLADDAKIAQLQLVANDPNATATEKRMALLEIERLQNEKVRRKIAADAKKEIDEKQSILDAELEKLRILEEQAALQKAFLDQQAESNRLLNDYINALEAAQKAAAGGAGGAPRVGAATPWGAGGGLGVEKGGGKPGELETRIRAFVETIKAKLAELEAVWGGVWTRISEKLEPARQAFVGLQTAWSALQTVFQAVAPEWEKFVATTLTDTINILTALLPHAIRVVTAIVIGFSVFWMKHHDEIFAVAGFIWNAIIRIILGALLLVSALIMGFLFLVNTNWKEKFNEMMLNAAAYMLSIQTRIRFALLTIRQNFFDKLEEIWGKIVSTWSLVAFFVRLKMNEVKESISDKITAALDYLTGVKESFVQKGKDFVQGIIDGIHAMAGALAGAIASMVSGMFTTANNEAKSESPSKRARDEIGLPIAQGTALGLLKGMGTVNNAMATMVGGAITPPASGRQQWGNQMVTNNSTTQFVLNANMSREANSVVHEFSVMQAMYGGA